MISYQDYEKAVYEWLMAKHEKDNSFTFSARIKGSKGAELNHFIGTEKSGYFGLTFWSIPVGFPGSAADLIDVFFEQKEDGFKFFFEFGQTKAPHDAQNTSALNLIRNLKEKIRSVGSFTYETTEDLKMFKYALGSPKPHYTRLEDLFVDLDKILNSILPIIENGIIEEKKINPDFNAQRITPQQFDEIQEKLEKRFIKYEHINEFDNDTTESFESFLERFNEEDLKIYFDFLKEIIYRFDLKLNDERLVFNIHNRRGHFSFTVGQRYCFMLSNNEKQGKYGFLSKDKLFENSEQFEGNHPRPWFTHMNEFNLDEAQKLNVFDGIEIELNRSPKSGFRKFNKPEFEAYVFGNDVIPEKKEIIKNVMSQPLNQILYGPPGTGKTYNSINNSLEILGIKTQGLLRTTIKNHFDEAVERRQIVFTTFHQSMSYEDFIEGIKPKTVGTNVVYEIKNGIFKKISDLAKDNYELSKNPQSNFSEALEMLKNELAESENNELKIETKKTHFFITNITDRNIEFRKASGATNHDLVITTLKELFSDKREMQSGLAVYYYPLVEKLKEYKLANNATTLQNYVLIIDEINRGNVSQIFGELITLIEDGKRLGQDETITLKLPYSQEDFVVPPNLYIIGTMNTADRSVEALDTALRRRFSFTEMLPQPELIKTEGPLKASQGIINGIDLSVLLSTINKRIEKLLDKDHQIGHSYFLKVDTLESLKSAFHTSIIPLLQEYFFGDYGKIGLVLGQGFFVEMESSEDEKFFAEFKDYEIDGILDKRVYHIKDVTQLDDNSFIEIVQAILPRQ
jgi:5-methylcytosine-specific restriction protein B